MRTCAALLSALLWAGSAQAEDLTPPEVVQPPLDQIVSAGTKSITVPLADVFGLQNVSNAQFARFKTELGIIDVELLEDSAPKTVANFLSYANRPAYKPSKKDQPFGYTRSIIHRSVQGSYFQGGGYVVAQPILATIPADAPVEHESSISNTRGTLATARTVANDPSSVTREWLFNTADNSATFDSTKDGATVFGRVITNGLSVMDALATVPVPNPGPWPAPFEKIPLQGHLAGGKNVHPPELVLVKSIAPIALTPAKSGEASLLKLKAKSSKPGLVSPVVKASNLALRFTKGAKGTATITVTARNSAGSEASTAFQVTVQ